LCESSDDESLASKLGKGSGGGDDEKDNASGDEEEVTPPPEEVIILDEVWWDPPNYKQRVFNFYFEGDPKASYQSVVAFDTKPSAALQRVTKHTGLADVNPYFKPAIQKWRKVPGNEKPPSKPKKGDVVQYKRKPRFG
jgi:hypothetical protein